MIFKSYGWFAPPSKKEPDCERAVIRFFGPITQQTRQPGRRQFYNTRETFSGLAIQIIVNHLGEAVYDNYRILVKKSGQKMIIIIVLKISMRTLSTSSIYSAEEMDCP